MEKATNKRSVLPASRARWLYLLAGCAMLLLLGLIYAWSVFIQPLEAEFGWNRAETSLTFTLSIILFCVGGIAGGLLTKRISPRAVLCLAAAVICTGFLLASRVSTLTGICLSYGVCVGLGVGLAYNALISTISKWFPDKKGLCTGILLMGFGAGGMLLGSLAGGLMAQVGWRTMFVGFAAAFAALLFFGALIIRPVGPNDVLPAPPARALGAATAAPDVKTGQMLRTRNFWMYFIWGLLLVAAGLIIIGHAAAVAADLGAGSGAAALIAGFVSVANGLGRILFGALFDRLGLKPAMMCINACALLAPACLLLAFSAGQIWLLGLGFLLTGAFYGGVPTMNATFAASYYGNANFPVNFSVVNSVLLFSPLIGSYLAGALHAAYGSYISSFVVMLAFAVVGAVASLLVKKLR